jgi:hypothetical protein
MKGKTMKSHGSFCLALLGCLAPVSLARAQEDNPHIGYVYPAGGQQGTTFQVVLGGQHLDGASIARVSGDGVQTKVIEHIRPLNQGQFKEMQNRMGELQKTKEAAATSGSGRRGRGGPQAFTNEDWTAEDEEMLAEIRKRLATFSIRRWSAPALVETVTLEVTVAEDAEPGERELRLQTEQGVTNPLVFCVGQLPEIAEESTRSVAVAESQQRGGRGRKRQQSARPDPGTSPMSDEPQVETEIRLPVTLNGQIVPGDVDRYRFQARQGQQLVAVVGARRLIPYLSDAVPGWFQAAVTLFDADGREVAYEDDFHFHPFDPVLHCQIPEDGQYVLEIKDALYRGREDFVYRIALGELPYVTGVFPLGSQSGTETKIELTGWNLPERATCAEKGDKSNFPERPEGCSAQIGLIPFFSTLVFQEPGLHWISVPAGRVLSNHVPFAVDSLPECLEREPNNEWETSQRVTFPMIINGRIDRPGDLDVFCIECRAGDQIVAEVWARRLGSPLDSVLKLTNAAGVQLAFNDDYEDRAAGLTTHHADSRLSATIPEDGLYYLHLGDAQHMGGDNYGYRLHIDTHKPDFELRVVPSSINARAGTTVPITVHALRKNDFSGDITLALKDPPAGFTLSGGLVAAGEHVVRLTLTVPPESSDPQSLSLEGLAKIQDRDVLRPAVPADDMMQAFIYRHLVPAKELQVCVIGTPRRLNVGLVSNETVKIPVGGTAQVLANLPSKSFFGEIQVELSDPPAGIAIEKVTLDLKQA